MADGITLENGTSLEKTIQNKGINLALENKGKVIPNLSFNDSFNLFKLYQTEKDNCNKYRMIFNIESFCTNVLYNTATEIVKDEGSENCICLNFESVEPKKNTEDKVYNFNDYTTIDAKQAIRDSEYSHPDLGGYVYHCGLDCFNNHRFRSDSFINIGDLNLEAIKNSGTTSNDLKRVFNTIEDYRKDRFGMINTLYIPKVNGVNNKQITYREIPEHVYTIDNCKTFYDAYESSLKEENGWYGFSNPTTIDIPVKCSKTRIQQNRRYYSLNKFLNGNKPNEFIDMYPDRSLFSFIPKKNKFRNRAEKNWDYCITYPYRSDYSLFNFINEKNDNNLFNISDCFISQSNNGIFVLVCKTRIKHNLHKGNKIRFFKEENGFENGNKVRKYYHTDEDIEIVNVGNPDNEFKDKEHYFYIYNDDISDFFDADYSEEIGGQNIFFKKVEGNIPCEYYFREFKKVENLDEEGVDRGFASEIGKLSYEENIFGDRKAQIIFTESIDVSGLIDNRGKEVHDLYLTIVKRNAGNKEWYDDKDTGNEKVEFSHCFGKVTSGLDLGTDYIDFNVRRMHNIDAMGEGSNASTKLLFKDMFGENEKTIVPDFLEDDITIDNDIFLGDIVEYSPYYDKETVIEKVYHRFNTRQREFLPKYQSDNPFKDLSVDEIDSDDMDIDDSSVSSIENSDLKGFSIKEEPLNMFNGESSTFFANLHPEGYFYSPHFKIEIKKLSETLDSAPGRIINFDYKYEKYNKQWLDMEYRWELNDGRIAYIVDPKTDRFSPDPHPIIVDSNNDLAQEEKDKILSWIYNVDKETFNEKYKSCLDEIRKNDASGTKFFEADYYIDNSYYTIQIKSTKNFGFKIGDRFLFYDKRREKDIWGVLRYVENNVYLTIILDETLNGEWKSGRYALIYAGNKLIPNYANYTYDSTQKFIWRKVLKASENIPTDKIASYPFSNGNIYITETVPFFCKRQDPFGNFGVRQPNEFTKINKMSNYIIEGTELDYSPLEYNDVDINYICE